MLNPLCVRSVILHMHNRIILLRRKIWANELVYLRHFLNQVRKSERSCICFLSIVIILSYTDIANVITALVLLYTRLALSQLSTIGSPHCLRLSIFILHLCKGTFGNSINWSKFVSFYSNTMSATSGAGTAYPFGTPEFTPSFSEVRVAQSCVFCVVLCRPLLLSYYFWSLHCLSFFH